MDADVKTKIENEIKTNKITIFMKGNQDFPQCGFSAAAVNVFEQLGVSFHTVDVLADWNIREGIKEFSNWPTIPQIYIDGEFVGGCDIIRTMHKNGELAEKLASAGLAS